MKENNNPSSLPHFCLIHSGSCLGSWVSCSPHPVVQSFHLLEKHHFSVVKIGSPVVSSSGDSTVLGSECCWTWISEGFSDQSTGNCPGKIHGSFSRMGIWDARIRVGS